MRHKRLYMYPLNAFVCIARSPSYEYISSSCSSHTLKEWNNNIYLLSTSEATVIISNPRFNIRITLAGHFSTHTEDRRRHSEISCKSEDVCFHFWIMRYVAIHFWYEPISPKWYSVPNVCMRNGKRENYYYYWINDGFANHMNDMLHAILV